jgi:hypothetical protein
MLACGVVAAEGTMVVFDNFGPGDSVSPGGTWFGTSPGGSSWNIAASAVVPSGSGPLANITLGMQLSGYPGPFVNEFVLMLCDDAGDKPGEVMWTQTFADRLPPATDHTPVKLTDLGTPTGPWLEAGHRYWLEARTPAGDSVTFHSWWAGLAPAVNSTAHQSNFFPNWEVNDNVAGWAMRVEVLPEPHAVIMLAIAFGLTLRSAGWRASNRHGRIP